LENLPLNHTPAILVANHQSYLDGIILCAVLPHPVKFVAKAELLKNVIPRLFLKGIDAEFVERFDKDKSVADAHRIAQHAHAVGQVFYFPEGTFTRQPGLLPFRLGAFLTAAEAQAPVIPIIIRGTRSVLRSGTWFTRFAPISVTISKPIEPKSNTEDSGRQHWNRAIELRDQARLEILKHNGEPDLAREKHPI